MISDIFGARIKFNDESIDTRTVGHEAIHYMQEHLGIMPQNNALTFAHTKLCDLIEKPEEFIGPNHENYQVVREPFRNMGPSEYLELVMNGKIHELTNTGWMLNPHAISERINEDPQDLMAKEIQTYLNNEAFFNEAFKRSGEADLTNTGGIRRPYTIMSNIGNARGTRAYALGHFTGDMENAWTLLWLHSKGVPFEEAERMIIQKYLDGTLTDLNIDKHIDTSQMEQYQAAEEIFRDKPINSGLLTEPAQWLENLKNWKRYMSRKNESIPENVLDAKYRIHEETTRDMRAVNSETGRNSLNVTGIASTIAEMLKRAREDNSGVTSNIYAFVGKDGKRTFSFHESREHFNPSVSFTQAESMTNPLTERIGRLNIDPYNETPPNIKDVLELIEDNRSVMSIVVRGEKVYVMEKSYESALAHNKLDRQNQRRRTKEIAQNYYKSMISPDRNTDPLAISENAFLYACDSAGIKVYRIDQSQIANEHIVLADSIN